MIQASRCRDFQCPVIILLVLGTEIVLYMTAQMISDNCWMIGVGFLTNETSSILFMARRSLDIWIVITSIYIYLFRFLITLTLQQMGIFFQNVHLPSIIVPYNRKIVAWNWPNTITIWWALWMLMAWYFNIWTLVATAWSTHPCVFMCIGVKKKSTCIQKRVYCTTENEVTLTNFIQETPLVLNHRKSANHVGNIPIIIMKTTSWPDG